MYEKAEEDAIETQLQERATQFAQELVKVSTVRSDTVRSGTESILRTVSEARSGTYYFNKGESFIKGTDRKKNDSSKSIFFAF